MNKIGSTLAHQAAAHIQHSYPNFKPKISIILGSGLGAFAEQLSESVSIPYSELPGFPVTTVHGHGSNVVLGYLSGIQVVCLQGRGGHGYEGADASVVKTYIRTLKLLGCEYFIATNAAGSLHGDMGPGELMVITDHINLQPTNPLVGHNDDEFGPRFYPLDNAYDRTMRDQLLAVADAHHIRIYQGVYISVLGPHYETAAEIKAFRILGADAVGMSTVPEVLVANHCGLKVAAISMITNYATGLAPSSHNHEAVVSTAAMAIDKLNILLNHFVSKIGQ